MDYYGLLLWPNPNRARPGILGITADIAAAGDDGDDDDDREKRWFPFVMILSREELITWRLA